MFPRRISNSIRQWMISSTAAIAVLALSGQAFGQEIKPTHIGSDKSSSTMGNSLSQNNDDFKMAPRWLKSTDLVGKKVINKENDDLGKIEDVVIDPNSGRILYGVLSFGGFLGIGDKFFAIPWQSLQLAGDNKALTLNVEKDRLKNAPGFEKSQWPNFADEQWATTTYKYYNQTPYWKTHADSSSVNYRQRWNQRATAWQKCTDLCGKSVVDARNEDTGTLSDCVIDPDGGRVIYGIVSFRDKFFAVPWSALTLPRDARQLVLNVNKDQLQDSIAFSKDNWPNMADEQWARNTFAHYRVQPYWTNTEASEQR